MRSTAAILLVGAMGAFGPFSQGAQSVRAEGNRALYGDKAAAESARAEGMNFRRSKRTMARVYADRRITFYCGCSYSGKTVDLESCGYVPRRNGRRAARLEWEHIVPASRLGRDLPCWRKGGRSHCRKVSEAFRRREGDPINLVPVIGEVNGDRSHYRFAEIAGEARQYGACDFERQGRRVEPPPRVRGDIARVYRYMALEYGVRLSEGERKRFAAWEAADPVDDWEIERLRRIRHLSRHHPSRR